MLSTIKATPENVNAPAPQGKRMCQRHVPDFDERHRATCPGMSGLTPWLCVSVRDPKPASPKGSRSFVFSRRHQDTEITRPCPRHGARPQAVSRQLSVHDFFDVASCRGIGTKATACSIRSRACSRSRARARQAETCSTAIVNVLVLVAVNVNGLNLSRRKRNMFLKIIHAIALVRAPSSMMRRTKSKSKSKSNHHGICP
jgi:hypothetical protein